MASIKVFIADDFPIVRAGIRNILEKCPDITVIGETGNGFEVVSLIKSLTPDLLILDLELPGKNGFEIVQQIEEERLPVCILVMSVHADKYLIEELLAAGVAGYLIKDEAPEMIVDAVRGIARGERGWVSRQVLLMLSSIVGMEKKPKNVELTKREKQILIEIAKGKSNGEIGFQLGIKDRTVEKHLTSIYEKLHISSRVEAAVYAARAGLVL